MRKNRHHSMSCFKIRNKSTRPKGRGNTTQQQKRLRQDQVHKQRSRVDYTAHSHLRKGMAYLTLVFKTHINYGKNPEKLLYFIFIARKTKIHHDSVESTTIRRTPFVERHGRIVRNAKEVQNHVNEWNQRACLGAKRSIAQPTSFDVVFSTNVDQSWSQTKKSKLRLR